MPSCNYSNPERTLSKYEERLIFLCGTANSFAVADDPIPDRSKVAYSPYYPVSLGIHRCHAGTDQ